MSFDTNDENSMQEAPKPSDGWRKFINKYHHQINGFFGWYIIHILLWLFFGVRIGDDPTGGEVGVFIVIGLIFLANLVGLLAFAIIRATRKVALGILLAIGLNFAISLVMGLEYNGRCFIPFVFPT